MASLSMSAARAGWTPKQNRLFEQALAVHDTDAPDRWHNVARAVGGGKSADDVRRYYELLATTSHASRPEMCPSPSTGPHAPGPATTPPVDAARRPSPATRPTGSNT
uniref:Uncharacterized protein n=1 Tax=Avena sativa TaxID=4498 RepID=A0ACD5T6X5_AVESA